MINELGPSQSHLQRIRNLSDSGLVQFGASKIIIKIQIGHKLQNKILQDRNLRKLIIANATSKFTNCYNVKNKLSIDKPEKGNTGSGARYQTKINR